MNEFMPSDFRTGDKVRFFGMKAKVIAGFEDIREMFPCWAVPIEIQETGFVTIAHVDQLTPRGKKK